MKTEKDHKNLKDRLEALHTEDSERFLVVLRNTTRDDVLEVGLKMCSHSNLYSILTNEAPEDKQEKLHTLAFYEYVFTHGASGGDLADFVIKCPTKWVKERAMADIISDGLGSVAVYKRIVYGAPSDIAWQAMELLVALPDVPRNILQQIRNADLLDRVIRDAAEARLSPLYGLDDLL